MIKTKPKLNSVILQPDSRILLEKVREITGMTRTSIVRFALLEYVRNRADLRGKVKT